MSVVEDIAHRPRRACRVLHGECRVKSAVLTIVRPLPVHPQLQTSHFTALSVAMCHKQTLPSFAAASEHIDKQGNEPVDQEEEEVRASAIKDARMVAKILLSHGADAARVALGVSPPNPFMQEWLRNNILFDPEGAASRLNSVLLEIDDDADHGNGGPRHYCVSATLYLPVNCDDDNDDDKPWAELKQPSRQFFWGL
jgi:hypothetical protein